MCPRLHTGHLPGFLNFSLFLNTKPQERQTAGSITNTPRCFSAVLRICSRCSYTSFSGIPTADDKSFAVRRCSLNSRSISLRTVSVRSSGSCGNLSFFRIVIIPVAVYIRRLFSLLFFMNLLFCIPCAPESNVVVPLHKVSMTRITGTKTFRKAIP